MTKQEAIERIRLVHCWTDINNNPTINSCECSLYMNNDGLCEDCEYHIAIECIKKCIGIGSCKECKSADFCYDNPDVCFCFQHEHTMYADDTCNYFYRDGSDNE